MIVIWVAVIKRGRKVLIYKSIMMQEQCCKWQIMIGGCRYAVDHDTKLGPIQTCKRR